MNLDRCWILFRQPSPASPTVESADDSRGGPANDGAITWHQASIRYADIKRQPSTLHGVPTLCGTITPPHNVDVLAYSTAAPRWSSGVCLACMNHAGTEHRDVQPTIEAIRCYEQNSVMMDGVVSGALIDDGVDAERLVVSSRS